MQYVNDAVIPSILVIIARHIIREHDDNNDDHNSDHNHRPVYNKSNE